MASTLRLPGDPAQPNDLPAILHQTPWVASVEETLARRAGVFDAMVLARHR